MQNQPPMKFKSAIETVESSAAIPSIFGSPLLRLVCAVALVFTQSPDSTMRVRVANANPQKSTPSQGARNSATTLEETILRHRARGDVQAETDALTELATLYQSLNENGKAVDALQKALALARNSTKPSRESALLNALGFLYSRLGDYQKSLACFSEAIPLWQAAQNSKGEAQAFSGTGTAYLRLNEYEKALDASQYALTLYERLGDQLGQASTRQQIGYLHFVQDQYAEAFDSYDKALTLARAAGDRKQEAVIVQSIGRAYFRRGDFQSALEHYSSALTLERAAQNQSGQATLLGAMGQVYRALGDNEKALDHLTQSLTFFRKSGERLSEATSLNNLAHVYLSLQQYQKAKSLFEESLEICRAINNPAGTASNTNGIGLANAGLGNYQTAIDFHLKALDLFRSLGHKRAEGDSLAHIGRAYLSLGEYQKALSFLNPALALYRSVRAIREEIQALYAISRAHRASGNPAQARTEIQAAIALVEKSREGVASEHLRTSYLASVRDLYALNIDILIELHKKNPEAGFDAASFEVSESSRARSLLDLLAEARADIRKGVDPALLERERSLHQLMASRAERQTQLQNTKNTPEQLAEVERELESFVSEYQEVQAQIRKSSPNYYALMQPEALDLSQLQSELLDDETLLLEYFLGPKQSYVWAVTQDSLAVFELGATEEIEKAGRRFYESVKAKHDTGEFDRSALRLTHLLLKPVAQYLNRKRLAIVADGVLHYIPFSALPSTALANPEGYSPLIFEHEVVSLPSASILAALNSEVKNREAAPNTIAVVADPVFDATDVRVRRASSERSLASRHSAASDLLRSIAETDLGPSLWPLPRLLGTRREARAILSLAGSEKSMQALDFDANKETVTSPSLGTHRVIHFATHALINNQHPELSGLVLSLVDKHGQPRDGFLRMSDVFNLRLPAELIVLSACQTGLGKEIRGEGFIGLTRGFMYAGSPRVLTSLWQVDDKSTSELMTRFYQGLLGAKRLSPAAALREAQIAMWHRKDWESPYHWAAFSLQGSWK